MCPIGVSKKITNAKARIYVADKNPSKIIDCKKNQLIKSHSFNSQVYLRMNEIPSEEPFPKHLK